MSDSRITDQTSRTLKSDLDVSRYGRGGDYVLVPQG